MHPQKLKSRGFNQAAILVRLLAKKLQIPYDLSSCQKIVNTLAQAQLDGDKRALNMRGAYKIKELPPYTHVALVDDLLTTGSTANELAKMLKKSGIARVEVWCCARTVNKF
jgi:predicted amidophosphoribosyltransferase